MKTLTELAPTDADRARELLDEKIADFYQPLGIESIRINRLKDGTRLAVLNDIHFPFHDQDALAAVEHFLSDWQPDIEVYAGDIVDFYSCSSFDTNPKRLIRLQDEIDVARLWLMRRKRRNPGARRIYLQGNHEDRMRRELWRDSRKLSSLRDLNFRTQMRLDDCECEDAPYRSKLIIHGFVIQHGHRASKSAAFPLNVARLMAVETGTSGLCGHDHRAQTYSWTDNRGSHTYVNNGCLCRLTQEYAPDPNWQTAYSYGVICAGVLQVKEVRIYPSGFWAEGKFYRV